MPPVTRYLLTSRRAMAGRPGWREGSPAAAALAQRMQHAQVTRVVVTRPDGTLGGCSSPQTRPHSLPPYASWLAASQHRGLIGQPVHGLRAQPPASTVAGPQDPRRKGRRLEARMRLISWLIGALLSSAGALVAALRSRTMACQASSSASVSSTSLPSRGLGTSLAWFSGSREKRCSRPWWRARIRSVLAPAISADPRVV